MNPDPFIGTGVGVTDVGAPSTFSFGFFLPIVPTVGPQTLTLAISENCTEGKAGSGCSITPSTLAPFTVSATLDGTPFLFNGGGLVCAGATCGVSFLTATATGLVGPFSVLDMHLEFKGSGGGASYGFSLRTEVTPVPEPSSYALLLAGLGAVGFIARRKKS